MPTLVRSAVSVPVIETERLRLRGHVPDDLDACTALWAHLEVRRHIGGRPFTREECWARLLRYAGHWDFLGFGCWLIEERATGAFVGEAGVWDYRREFDLPLPAPLSTLPEVGWVLAPEHQGKGYATEAVQSAMDWGRTMRRMTGFTCIIAPENLPSMRVAERCGFHEALRTSYKGNETVVFHAAS